jgi:sigma-B regulation protein RsbU (phosphoserine phosphatase)
LAEKQERLLLITTPSDQHESLKALLREAGYELSHVENINLAQKTIDVGLTSLVVLDSRDINDEEQESYGSFVSQQSSQNMPVLILVNSGEMEKVAYFIESGATDYLQAPFDLAQIRLRVASAIERTRLYLYQEGHMQNADLLKIEQDIQTARRIQAGFLPKTLPEPDGWEVAARFQPAREVAGDFYDAFYMSQNRRVGFVIADVVDKGVPAALFMALVRSLTRAFAEQHYALSWTDALEGTGPIKPKRGKKKERRLPSTGTIALYNAVLLTNNYIMDNHLDLNMFATLFFGMFDPRNGDLAYINAGHNPPFIVGQDGEIKAKLDSTGPAVGMFPGVDFIIEYSKIEPGDTLFAYTDGVTEARAPNGDFLTEKKLIELISQPDTNALGLVDFMDDILKNFIADAVQFDDITMIAVHREASSDTE